MVDQTKIYKSTFSENRENSTLIEHREMLNRERKFRKQQKKEHVH